MSPSEDEPSGESQRHSLFTDTNSSTDDTNDIDININNHNQTPKIDTTTTTSSSVKIGSEEALNIPIETPSAKTISKKSNKRRNDGFWNTTTSRKSKKKSKSGNAKSTNGNSEGTLLLTPIPRFLDRTDDKPEMSICLSKVYKAEGVELSDDRMTAGSIKGYRMVRATGGVTDGAWYFEIKVMLLGESGHTRLGWCMDKADLQGPVGYDMNSFGYRDIDGSKFHQAVREVYGGEGYKEGDVIGFYVNLPNGMDYAPKEPQLVPYKGQNFLCHPDGKEEPPKIIPGSEISFFKNGVCQGVAFKDLCGGRYYPAASMYTLPAQPKCEVKFNFGPHFDFFPNDFLGRRVPKPMIEVPYHGFEIQTTEIISSEKQK